MDTTQNVKMPVPDFSVKRKRPLWLNKKIAFKDIIDMQVFLKSLKLNTVCQSASCPNIGECFSKGEATFMILGRFCSRNCKFCNINEAEPEPVDANEPFRIAKAVKELKLKHAVITSVTRDDLSDGGADIFSQTVSTIKKESPAVSVEVLIPDFNLRKESIKKVLSSNPDIVAHNLETVPGLYRKVRPKSDYRRSLDVLEAVKNINSAVFTKSGLMLGLGEQKEEILKVFGDLRRVSCDFLSLGQYLSPTLKHYPVQRYLRPREFQEYRSLALKLGFKYVLSGPYVRSSYKASDYLDEFNDKQGL
ncbi:MAG: lipoyl synthase [Candidatus Omnitrophica bacterium]|nr:lipoyl synthase [Candidatus Omnitrophota bacterium]